MVFIINEQTGPLKRTRGHVVVVRPGADGICRVVNMMTAVLVNSKDQYRNYAYYRTTINYYHLQFKLKS